MIERCLSFTVYWLWDCTAADLSCWLMSTTESCLQQLCEHQNWTIEQQKKWLGLMTHVFFYIMWMAGYVCITQRTMGKKWADRGSVKFWALFFWETMGPGTQLNVTLKCTTYVIMFTPLMATVFHNGNSLFQRDKEPCHTAKHWTGLRNMTKHSLFPLALIPTICVSVKRAEKTDLILVTYRT